MKPENLPIGDNFYWEREGQMSEIFDIKDTLPLPYILIETDMFKFNYIGLQKGQNEKSIKYGVMGDFSIQLYDNERINISEKIDATVGDVYSFYKDLETMMKNIQGTAEINLFDVCLNFTAKKTGIIEVNGVYKPFINFGLVKEIKFGFNVEPNVLDNALKRFKTLFDSLAEIQGNYNFIF